jgi:hypothetical protein
MRVQLLEKTGQKLGLESTNEINLDSIQKVTSTRYLQGHFHLKNTRVQLLKKTGRKLRLESTDEIDLDSIQKVTSTRYLQGHFHLKNAMIKRLNFMSAERISGRVKDGCFGYWLNVGDLL